MKKIFILVSLVLCVFTFWFYARHPLVTRVKIRGHKFTVDLAITPKEKERGLGGRDGLAPDRGMLFPYDHTEQYSFWMKDMRFPIDIIWIRDNLIIDISRNVPVESGSQLRVYQPREPANKVLEINAGVSDANDFQIGDLVRILN